MRKSSFNASDAQKINNCTMTVPLNVKCIELDLFLVQNLELLYTILGEVSQINNQQTAITSGKVDMTDKILDLIKNRIKTNYDKLYESQEDNKKTIFQQIQQVEGNISGQNAKTQGFQNVIKEKTTYEKIKSQLQIKHKKLKKLTLIRDELKGGSLQNSQFNEIIKQNCTLMQSLQCYKQILDHQTSVLINMKSERRAVKLFLKEKHDKMLADEQFKKQRTKKLQNINRTKKASLNRINEQLKTQEQCQISQNKAEELDRKLQQYQGKYVHQKVVKHQKVIIPDQQKRAQAQQADKKQQSGRLSLSKQIQQQRQYQLAYNFFLIKEQEQQKIKKICGISNLSQIVSSNLQFDLKNLQLIKREIRTSIGDVRNQSSLIREDISLILLRELDYGQQSLLKAEEQYVNAEKQIKNLQANSLIKLGFLNQWHAIIQMMDLRQISKQSLTQSLDQILQMIVNKQKNKHKKRFSLDHSNRNPLSKETNSKCKKIEEQHQSECNVLQ